MFIVSQNSFFSIILSLTFTDTARQIIITTISPTAICHPERVSRNCKPFPKLFRYTSYSSLHAAATRKITATTAFLGFVFQAKRNHSAKYYTGNNECSACAYQKVLCFLFSRNLYSYHPQKQADNTDQYCKTKAEQIL